MTLEPSKISSASNPLVKMLRSLERKKGRREHNAFLAEGARLATEALANAWTPVAAIYGSGTMARDGLSDIISELEAKGARAHEVSDRLLGQIARKDNPQTLVCAFQPKWSDLSGLDASQVGSWLALYEIRDPGNLGTILRTADFAGVNGVILVGDCCDPFSMECVRASMGSLFAMPMVAASWVDFHDWTIANSLPMIAASMNGDTPHHDANYAERSVILMGNEQKGLPETVEAKCKTLARIPMREGADSLNLANATTLMIYAAWAARGYAGAT